MKLPATAMSSAEEVSTTDEAPNGETTEPVANGLEETPPVSSNGNSSSTKESDIKDENDFSDYLWMENMEEYDQEIMRQLEEDILISHYSDIYEDSLLEDGSPGPTTASLCVMSGPILPPLPDSVSADDLDAVTQQFSRTMAFSSRLNPNAQEFVPKTFSNVPFQH